VTGRLARAAVAAAALLVTPRATPAAAQRSPAFGTITLGLSITRNINRNAFHERWAPGTGFGATAETPFHAGHVELGAEQLGFDARTAAAPGFRGRYYFAGWHLQFEPHSRIRLGQGIRLGSFTMRFDDPSLPEGRRDESEIAIELVTRAAWRLDRRWRATVSGQYRHTWTEPSIRLFNVTAGVSRAFDSPRWLRDFLD
jgi:hypothetical protein